MYDNARTMSWEVRAGHVLDLLRAMPPESVHMVCTSPPYWGLRSYKTDPQRWSDGWCGELGLEPTPELYVQHLVEVFREVRQVLRKDGTCWVNLGDSYVGGKGASGQAPPEYQQQRAESVVSLNQVHQHLGLRTQPTDDRAMLRATGLKPKDLVGVPWRVAFALQTDSWYLRSDIIWVKPNPMPESVTDRPTKAHEYIFMLTKSERYYYDQEAIREPAVEEFRSEWPKGWAVGDDHSSIGWNQGEKKKFSRDQGGGGTSFPGHSGTRKADGTPIGTPGFRNKRTVWTIATQPFPDAHFATFPERLVEPCIKAGTSEKGCCATCGMPWRRNIRKHFTPQQDVSPERGIRAAPGQKPMDESNTWNNWPRGTTATEMVRWQANCSCGAEVVPCTVLDPFCGSGTTGVVALKLGRAFIGLELQPSYVEMAKRRIGSVMPLFDQPDNSLVTTRGYDCCDE